MTPREALNRLEFYDILCLQNVANGKGKTNKESLETLTNLGLIFTIDGRYRTSDLGGQVLKLHSETGRKND
ncbi:hypothetical protein [Corynebacterium mastitidis]|uniref:hypothetical protein n=1 Tax=Corynebacterium mastitidis TaxID=161890 RepID=UPI0025518DA6|nr:hypothetical protein [Corynebacterium mastitidis]MDK8450965.1 hypothetical protein [Corynebacterium mastitidis]